MSQNVGRNDPCPCGSGKKYKKCCLPLEREIGGGRRVEDFLHYAAEWILNIDWLRDEFEEMKSEYTRKNEITDDMYFCLLDAFIFDFILPTKKMTPLRYFLQHADLSPRFKDIYRDFTRNILTFFEVVDVDFDRRGMIFKNIVTNDLYVMRMMDGVSDLFLGDLVLSRVAPFKDSFVSLTPVTKSYYTDLAFMLKETLYRFPADRRRGSLSGFDLLDIICNKKQLPDNLVSIKKSLKKKLTSIGLNIDFRTLNKRINNHDKPEEAFPEIYEFDFLTNRDHMETLQLVQLLWDNYPRHDLNGSTIAEVYPIGPKEDVLRDEFFALVKNRVNPKEYNTIEEAQTVADRFREEWLDTPHQMLDGKTPRQEILVEREQLNNPSATIDLDTKIVRIKDYDENLAEKLYLEGIDAFNAGSIVEAAGCFDQVTKMYSGNYKAWANLGISCAYCGNKKEAIRFFKKALSLNPEYTFAQERLLDIRGKTEKELAMIGMVGAFKGAMYTGFGKNRKKRKEKINVWKELNKEMKKTEHEKKDHKTKQ
ncbi:MAG: SEC-C metal-binding domain-containing protein [Petrotogales bacterium]